MNGRTRNKNAQHEKGILFVVQSWSVAAFHLEMNVSSLEPRNRNSIMISIANYNSFPGQNICRMYLLHDRAGPFERTRHTAKEAQIEQIEFRLEPGNQNELRLPYAEVANTVNKSPCILTSYYVALWCQSARRYCLDTAFDLKPSPSETTIVLQPARSIMPRILWIFYKIVPIVAHPPCLLAFSLVTEIFRRFPESAPPTPHSHAM